MKILSNKKQYNAIKPKRDRNMVITCYLMLALPIIGFFVFTLYPILWSGRMSFFSYSGLKSSLRYIGLDNFKNLFADSGYWHSWIVTLLFMVVKLPVEALIAFVFAYMLTQNTKFAGFYRSAYFMPSIISAAIAGLVFSNMFDYFGVINANIVKFGLVSERVNWFSKFGTSIAVVFITTFWQSFGMTVLYYIAAISNVPKEVLESADMDGANKVVVLFKIILPMILPVLQVVLLISMQGALYVGEIVLILTGGAPGGQTHTVQSYLMSRILPGFGGVSDVGYMAAVSVVTSIICCIIALIFSKTSEKIKNMY